jgi:hypothetical protein
MARTQNMVKGAAHVLSWVFPILQIKACTVDLNTYLLSPHYWLVHLLNFVGKFEIINWTTIYLQNNISRK